MKVAQLTEQIRGWEDRLPGFGVHHAEYGARLAKCVTDGFTTTQGESLLGLGNAGPSSAHDLALDIAWIFWLDDCFDTAPETSGTEMLSLRDFLMVDGEQPLEVTSAARVRAGLRIGTRPDPAWELWMRSVVEMVRAFQRNKRASRGGVDWTFAEYVDNGEISTAVPHFMATISLVHGLNMHERVGDPRFARMLRHLSLEMRLENDLVSYVKEREEGDLANAVLIMSELLGLEDACAFVEQQRRGHERMLLATIEEFGVADPLARAARLILEGAHWFHATERGRYFEAPEPTAKADSPQSGFSLGLLT